ncbi:MAG: glycosyltransferase family 2 protein [Thermoanaerobaculia bacterium]
MTADSHPAPSRLAGGAARVREITAILVSWHDAGETEAAVASLAAARRRMPPGGPAASLVVVENGGAVRADALEALWPGAVVITNRENRGLGPAGNQAAAAATGDVLLFLNPDTRAEGDPFTGLAEAFGNAGVVAVAPRLLDDGVEPRAKDAGGNELAGPGREDQFTFQLRRLPTLAGDAAELLLIDHLFPNNPARRRTRYADSDRERPIAVEQAAGAALAIRSDAFAAVGGFDERYVPAWFEDVDLCARLSRRGAILYFPGARFRHRGGASSRRLGYDRFLPMYYRNALLYRRLHYPAPAWLAYRLLLTAGMLMRLAALPFRRRVPHPKDEAARGYLAVLEMASSRFPSPDSRLPLPDA